MEYWRTLKTNPEQGSEKWVLTKALKMEPWMTLKMRYRLKKKKKFVSPPAPRASQTIHFWVPNLFPSLLNDFSMHNRNYGKGTTVSLYFRAVDIKQTADGPALNASAPNIKDYKTIKTEQASSHWASNRRCHERLAETSGVENGAVQSFRHWVHPDEFPS